jgi:hypothetical protein
MLSVYCLIIGALLFPWTSQGGKDLSGMVSNAPVIAVARITSVEESPGVWSAGGFVNAQKVSYEIISVMKGEVRSKEITVYHYLFKDSPNASKYRPELSPSLFMIGSESILFLRPIPTYQEAESSPPLIKEYAETNTSSGVVPANKENIRKVRKALRVASVSQPSLLQQLEVN